jgi:hypothetical protein
VAITRIISYLVPAAKGEEEVPDIQGTVVPLRGKLFAMLEKVFDRSDTECDIPIAFRATDGQQSNDVREEIVAFAQEHTMVAGRALARRLSGHTNSRSGLGLLFLMIGEHRREHKLVISRFPAEEGILAETHGHRLQIEFIERIFMKRAFSYKAALYSGTSFDNDFWDGMAIDKQIGERPDQLANYWIHGFLDSDFRTTPAAGTRRLAVALKGALEHAPNADVRQEILSAATLARGRGGQAISVRGFMEDLQLSDEAQAVLLAQLANPAVADERFVMTRDEFDRHLTLRSVELNNGVSLTGPVENFDQVVTRRQIDGEEYRFTTQGRIVAERLRKN